MTDFFSISPLLIVFFTPIAVMLIAVMLPKTNLSLFLAFIGVAVALCFIPIFLESAPLFVGRFFVADAFSKICHAGLLLAALVVIVLSREWFASSEERVDEYSILLLISLVGAMALVMSSHFLSFFVTLELLSIPVYALIAYHLTQRRGLEAALKYILLAGFSIAILLFGMALLYKEFGTLEFDGLIRQAQLAGPAWSLVGWVGFTLFFAGIAFKVGLVPFHMWLPDVYEGAPVPVTAYLTTISKGAVLFFTLRFLNKLGVDNLQSISSILVALAILSMFLGNIMALKQQNLKRLLAYSSIAQVGYMFIGVLSGRSHMLTSTLFFVFGYFAAILCALGVLVIHSRFDGEKEHIKSLEGLFFTKPLAAAALTIALLSFTGLPLTVGFFGKFFVLFAGVDALNWAMAISLVASSAIGFYAYFKVIVLMATRGTVSMLPPRFELSEALVFGLALVVIYLGVMPSELTRLIAKAVVY